MPLIDFKEIPIANSGKGNQDLFELFAREFLSEIGYEIIEEPARGADGGKDLIILERRTGIGGNTDFRWLVSCKHFAFNKKGIAGKSVSTSDEPDILDRVKSKNCNGFLGFYSTLPSSGLMNKLDALSTQISYQIFDSEKIERQIIGYQNRENLFMRFFPNSYKNWKDLFYYTEPVKLFNAYFQSKYEIFEEVLRAVFGSVENTIKSFREKDSIEDLFLEQNLELIVFSNKKLNSIIKPLAEIFIDYSFSVEFKKPSNNEQELETSISQIGDIVIDEIFKNNLELSMRVFRFVRYSASPNVILVLRDNSLLINKNGKKMLDDMFADLKNMLS